MLADINGEVKKVACPPCIRGHRSSKCNHQNRLLIEVRKPGRPLSSCPHPSGSCDCQRARITYTIPTTSTCARSCPPDKSKVLPAVASGTQSMGRVQKNRHRKSVSSINLDYALKELDGARPGVLYPVNTQAEALFAPSEGSSSNGASGSSSASSTPFMFPMPPQQLTQTPDFQLPAAYPEQQPTTGPSPVSNCCSAKAKAEQEPKREARPRQGGNCCAPPLIEPSDGPTPQTNSFLPRHLQTQMDQMFAMTASSQPVVAFPNHGYGTFSQNFEYNMAAHMTSNIPANLNVPIHKQMAQDYQQSRLEPGLPTESCMCGDSCKCLACLQHPRNSTTTDYVRGYAEFMATGNMDALPPSDLDMAMDLHHPSYSMDIYHRHLFNLPINTSGHLPASRIPAQPNPSTAMALQNNPQAAMSSWANGPMEPVSPLNTNVQYFNTPDSAQLQSRWKTEAAKSYAADTADSPRSDGEDILSPSVFKAVEVEFPTCSDPSGICGCGPGCACPNCFTHGGQQSRAHTTIQNASAVVQGGFPPMSNDQSITWDQQHEPLNLHFDVLSA